MRKVYLLIVVSMFLTISTLGCNAMRGAGTDLADTGKHISNIGN
jgi:predicted small secreted protein